MPEPQDAQLEMEVPLFTIRALDDLEHPIEGTLLQGT